MKSVILKDKYKYWIGFKLLHSSVAAQGNIYVKKNKQKEECVGWAVYIYYVHLSSSKICS